MSHNTDESRETGSGNTDKTARDSDDSRTKADGSVTLKFASGPRTTMALAAESGTLGATIRYNDEKDIQENDEIWLQSADGETFGSATVEHSGSVPVRDALNVVRLHWAEYGIQSIDGLVSALNDYYDDTISLQTDVKVLILDPSIHPAETDDGTEESV